MNKKIKSWHNRFTSKFSIPFPVDKFACWNWKAGKTKGYGMFYLNGRSVGAHRVSYELYVGKIPKGLTLDHLCRNTACVNPRHLEPVTLGVNVLRSNNLCAVNARKTHCKNGHKFTKENTYYFKSTWVKDRKFRQCKKCWAEK